MGGVIDRGILARHDHDTHLDRGVDGLHLREVILGPSAVGVGIVRYRLLIGANALVDGQMLVNPALSYIQDKPGIPAANLIATGAQ